MKAMKMACLALLCPALAFAGPNKDTDKQGPTEIESQTFEWSSGQGRLGVMVMSLAPELRSYFGR